MKHLLFSCLCFALWTSTHAQPATPGTVMSATRISARAGSLGVSPNWKQVGQAVTSFPDLDGDSIRELVFTALDLPSVGQGIYIYRINANGELKSTTPTILSKGYAPLNALPTKYPFLPDAERIGVTLTTLKDLNGNGVDEIVAGDFYRPRLYVLFMNAAGGADSFALIQEGVEGFSLLSGEGIGMSLSSVGDIDADGIEDIAVYAGTLNGYGAVYVMMMKANGRVRSYKRLSHNSNGIGALTPDYSFGSSLRGIGDLDGDGVPDIMASAFPDANSNRGEVWTLFMNSDGTVKNYVIIKPGTTVFPDTVNAEAGFGSQVTRIGDLDGDTVVDVAVSAPGFRDSLGAVHGRVYILFMKRDGTPKATQVIDRHYGGLSLPIDTLSFFGYGMFSPGDFNKDGIPDLGVGAPNAREAGAPPPAIPFNGTGAVYMLALNGVPIQTGVGDLLHNFSQHYFLYPNPASDRIYIRARKPSGTQVRVRLLDALGRTLTVVAGVDGMNSEIEVASLPTGTYTIAIETSEGVEYGRFVKK